jgi:hypothetical protein
MRFAETHTSIRHAGRGFGQAVSERVRCPSCRTRAGRGRRRRWHLGRVAEMAQDAPRGAGGVARRDQSEPTPATGTRQHIHGKHAPSDSGLAITSLHWRTAGARKG